MNGESGQLRKCTSNVERRQGSELGALYIEKSRRIAWLARFYFYGGHALCSTLPPGELPRRLKNRTEVERQKGASGSSVHPHGGYGNPARDGQDEHLGIYARTLFRWDGERRRLLKALRATARPSSNVSIRLLWVRAADERGTGELADG